MSNSFFFLFTFLSLFGLGPLEGKKIPHMGEEQHLHKDMEGDISNTAEGRGKFDQGYKTK